MGTFTAGTTLPSPILTQQARSSCTTQPAPPWPPSSTRPAMPADPARQCPPDPARRAPRPDPPCPPTRPAVPPTRPAVPADPARHARRPAQPSRAAGRCPLLRPQCRRPGQPRIFQLPAHQRQLAHFPLLLSENVAILATPLKMSQLPE